MNFTAIDFETAANLIPCEIGVCVVQNGVIVETRSWLIKPSCFPYMDYRHQQIHGISVGELEHVPYFDDLWDEIEPYLDHHLLVAHNANFDISVLKSALNNYNIPYPDINYLCSVRLSRRAWEKMDNYRLDTLCREFGIVFRHHRAGDDAEACAKLVLKAAEDAQLQPTHIPMQLSLDIFRPNGLSIYELTRKLKVTTKYLI